MTPYFPIFISLKKKKILIYGAGTVGQRRIATLLPFCPKLTVIAPDIPLGLRQSFQPGSAISWIEKTYTPGEIAGYDFVLAATSQQDINHAIYLECKGKKIPVNNASCQQECDFFFPAIVQEGEITMGLCSGGQNHAEVRHAAARLRSALCAGELGDTAQKP